MPTAYIEIPDENRSGGLAAGEMNLRARLEDRIAIVCFPSCCGSMWARRSLAACEIL